GRTGRAGASGQAISLVSADESGLLRDIQRVLNREIERVEVEGFVPSVPLRMTAGGGGDRGAPRTPRNGPSRAAAPRSGPRPPARHGHGARPTTRGAGDGRPRTTGTRPTR